MNVSGREDRIMEQEPTGTSAGQVITFSHEYATNPASNADRDERSVGMAALQCASILTQNPRSTKSAAMDTSTLLPAAGDVQFGVPFIYRVIGNAAATYTTSPTAGAGGMPYHFAVAKWWSMKRGGDASGDETLSPQVETSSTVSLTYMDAAGSAATFAICTDNSLRFPLTFNDSNAIRRAGISGPKMVLAGTNPDQEIFFMLFRPNIKGY